MIRSPGVERTVRPFQNLFECEELVELAFEGLSCLNVAITLAMSRDARTRAEVHFGTGLPARGINRTF